MRALSLLLLAFLSLNLYAQDTTVTWNLKITPLEGGKTEVRLEGTVKEAWHVYTRNEAIGLNGVQLVFPDTTFRAEPPSIKGELSLISDPIFDGDTLEVLKGSFVLTQIFSIEGERPGKFPLTATYESGDPANFIPGEFKTEAILDAGAVKNAETRILIPSIDLANPVRDCGKDSAVSMDAGDQSLFYIFLLGFIGGLVALLTPCVFPMIPLTVSFFTKKAGSRKSGIRNAFMYGFFIFLIYVLLSLPFHFLDSLNPEILNNISTNVVLNVIFFAIFVFFAFSFFGFYEITLPSGLSSKADSKAGAGNIAGIFFMALTLAIVSFSCTGPILGSLLAGSLSGDGGATQLTMGMAGFGLALALPFALFALFPNWLNSLPKSGGWLSTVKVVLGFLELGLAFKFLSNADMVKHWGILPREVFIGIWVIIGVGLTLYLFGKIRFPHDSPIKKLSPTRKLMGTMAAIFTIYLIPGLTNTKYANLTLISGFPPPLYYSVYQQENDCILGLNCAHDYEEGLAMARQQNKAILLDFTGYACVNCRRMEENVWSKPDVYALMKEKFIVISLYVDDKKKLPVSERFTYTTREGVQKEIRTVGDKWATFETENFRNNAQPLYAILDTNEKLMNHPVGYMPSAVEYLAWLQCGVEAFEQGK